MITTTSDTLNYFEKLKNAGFTEGQGSGRGNARYCALV